MPVKVQNAKPKAVNISESNIPGISYGCNASEEVRDPSSTCRFTLDKHILLLMYKYA